MDETKLTKQDKEELLESAKELLILQANRFIKFAQKLIIETKKI